jgi:IS4 transposase
LLTPHYKRTVERIRQSDAKYILAIQDGMRLNYTKHPAKTELGRIGKIGQTDLYGLIQHSTLCVTDKNEPLGLIDVQHFDYDEFDTTVHHHHRKVEDKASRCWVDALKNMRKRLKDTEKRIITVADREGDFYEFLYPLIEENEEFVIRSKHNRYTGEKHRERGEQLKSLLNKASVQGRCEVEIQDVDTREIKTLSLNLKAIKITIPPPNKSKEEQASKTDYKPISINVVHAFNDEYSWILLTNLPIDTLEQIKEIIEIYRSRWHIEDYHKVLKTGYQVDEIYLHSSREAIENLLVMASISACRLYWLIYIGRTEINIKADQLFEEFEWKAMYVFFKEKIPDECPALSEVILRIAQLGGYKPKTKVSPPGIKTLWIGYQHFTIAAQMYRNMSSET